MSINFGGFSTSIGSADVGRQLFVADTTYQYTDNLTILRGRHMMKTGFRSDVDQLRRLFHFHRQRRCRQAVVCGRYDLSIHGQPYDPARATHDEDGIQIGCRSTSAAFPLPSAAPMSAGSCLWPIRLINTRTTLRSCAGDT